MRALSNKALAVLGLLREGGERSCREVAATIRERTPCGVCDGTGEGDDSRYGCRKCYGRGQVSFYYSQAYVALRQLQGRGLASRRYLTDEFGDVTPMLVWSAVDTGAHVDELEELFRAPALDTEAVQGDSKAGDA
ncbi:MAG: hypothetical protein M3540_13575 [Actinomycetota bacterium]|nr:hypothetical protein [Actinomycetota bacterium]